MGLPQSVPPPRAIRFGSYVLDPSSGELHKNGTRLRLPEQPFRILQLLLQHPGEVVTREELQQKLWPAGTFVDFETGLNSAVKKLRDVLGDSADCPRYIETIPRHGYRFIHHFEDWDWPSGPTPREAVPSIPAARPTFAPAWGTLALVVIVAAVSFWNVWQRPRVPALPIRFTDLVTAPRTSSPFWDYRTVAISPDGTHLAYVHTASGTTQLYVRPLDKLESAPVPDTTGATAPFFSPDGRWIGYFAAGKLMKVSVSGGVPVALCDVSNPLGADWGPDDTIIFAPRLNSGIWRISASGGLPRQLTTLDAARGENSHRWPSFLPGGRAVIFTVKTLKSATFDDTDIAVQLLASKEHRTVLHGGSDPRYFSSGHMVFARAGTLRALPFNLKELRPAGPPISVLEGVSWTPWTGAAQYAVSSSGTLAYVAGSSERQIESVVWVNRLGAVHPTSIPPRAFRSISLSPDATRIAAGIGAANDDIWLSDVARGSLTRLTAETGNNDVPIWTPDGKRILFLSDKGNTLSFYWQSARSPGNQEPLLRLTPGHEANPDSISPDGQFLVYSEADPGTKYDLWLLPLTGASKPRPLLRTPFNEREGMISPDGKWLAYTSDQSGRNEVYVQPFRGTGASVQVSSEGGGASRWARNGRDLFYRNGNKMMLVTYAASIGFVPQKPKLLFAGRFLDSHYGVSLDAQRFAMVQLAEPDGTPRQLNVVVNWIEELKQHAPGK